uniref:Uncharacterized protein n=1 Tax=Tetraselmis sp. GSL018 TaxID=582737 RepID=A0A061QUH0_9CHLO
MVFEPHLFLKRACISTDEDWPVCFVQRACAFSN